MDISWELVPVSQNDIDVLCRCLYGEPQKQERPAETEEDE